MIEKLMMESLLDKINSGSTVSTFISQISVEDSVSFQNEWNAIKKKQEGQPVVIDKSYEKYFSLEYYHEGKEDQCFVCGIEKASVIEEELKMCGRRTSGKDELHERPGVDTRT